MSGRRPPREPVGTSPVYLELLALLGHPRGSGTYRELEQLQGHPHPTGYRDGHTPR